MVASLARNFRDVGLHLHMSVTALLSKKHGGKWDRFFFTTTQRTEPSAFPCHQGTLSGLLP